MVRVTRRGALAAGAAAAGGVAIGRRGGGASPAAAAGRTDTEILNLFLEIQRELGVAMLFISHDLAVVRHLSDRVVVMYAGRVVEVGPTEDVCASPHHPYTRALLDASLEPEPSEAPPARASTLRETVPDQGCPFVPRCPLAEPACRGPVGLAPTTAGRLSACRRAGELVRDEAPVDVVSQRARRTC